MSLKGKVWCFGENINTDLIFPNRYFKPSYRQGEMASHVLSGADPDFPNKVGPGNIIVGGRNFGCGSSREEAAASIREAGIAALVAPSFGRIFTRNCINLGIPVVHCPEIEGEVSEGDVLEIDLGAGKLWNVTTGFEASFTPMSREILALIEIGGIAEYTRRMLKERSAGK